MTNVYEFRVFQNARNESRPLGKNVYRATVQSIKREQDAGRSGQRIVGELAHLRRTRNHGHLGPSGDAA